MQRSIPWTFLGVVTLVVTAPPAAWAWGEEGHVAVARIAENHLSAKARAGIGDLIGDRSISDKKVALWADLIKKSSLFQKKYPRNQTWHYIDLPAGVENPSIAEFCKDDNCVVEAVKRFRAVLADPQAGELQRKEALFFLVHFIGDLHQPLHCAALD